MKVYDPQALGLVITKVSGVEAKLRCPFHFDKTPSAAFNLSTGLFHCFGCGYSANAYQLAKHFDGEISKIELSTISFENDEREWKQLSYSPLAIKNKYLKKRGVLEEQIHRFGILQCDDGILFPIHNRNGFLVGLQLRKYEGEPKYVLNGERTAVWPMANLRYEKLLMVEGVFGVLRADSFGIKAVCTMGASAIPAAAMALSGHEVTVAFDDDLAGYLGAYSFIKIHKNSNVVLPGMEVDEATEKELTQRIGGKLGRDILNFAIETHNRKLFNMIRQKERQQDEDKKRNFKRIHARA